MIQCCAEPGGIPEALIPMGKTFWGWLVNTLVEMRVFMRRAKGFWRCQMIPFKVEPQQVWHTPYVYTNVK
jgi:hypothetical protein